MCVNSEADFVGLRSVAHGHPEPHYKPPILQWSRLIQVSVVAENERADSRIIGYDAEYVEFPGRGAVRTQPCCRNEGECVACPQAQPRGRLSADKDAGRC